MPRDLIAALGDGPVQLAGFTLSLEYRSCGKCQRCPHGPYLYARDRTGRRHYIGSPSRLSKDQITARVRALFRPDSAA